MTYDNEGDINGVLVKEYWPLAKWDGTEWRCGGIDGRPLKNKGSFYITADGFAGDFDGSYPRTLITTAIWSRERRDATGVKVGREEVFAIIKAGTGVDFTPIRLPVLHLASVGLTTLPECHAEAYKGMAETRGYFLRDENFVYPEESTDLRPDEEEDATKLGTVLRVMDEYQLCSDLERVFTLERKRYDKAGEVVSSATECGKEEAKKMLRDRRAQTAESLPLRLLAATIARFGPSSRITTTLALGSCATPGLIETGSKRPIRKKRHYRAAVREESTSP